MPPAGCDPLPAALRGVELGPKDFTDILLQVGQISDQLKVECALVALRRDLRERARNLDRDRPMGNVDRLIHRGRVKARSWPLASVMLISSERKLLVIEIRQRLVETLGRDATSGLAALPSTL